MLKAVLLAGLVGTSLMTAFSYALSQKKKRNFKEPELLGLLLQKWRPSLKKEAANIAGWELHYAMGEGWAIFYLLLLKILNKKPAFYTAFLFGCFGGVVAVLIWKASFKLNPDPPKTAYISNSL